MHKRRDIFGRDLDARKKMITLRESGWSYPRLAKLFDCDHTTIMYNIKRFCGDTQIVVKKDMRPTAGKKEYVCKELTLEVVQPPVESVDPVNEGHTYKEYRALGEKRRAGLQKERDARMKRLKKEKAERDARKKKLGIITSKTSLNNSFHGTSQIK